ncbi:hypothetical protein AGMMS50289_04140 [Betaproteobacteria bacterium]|nr:hypothetical protein AGMMS50289_04140 [Betaproteobacteria bacterium]
MSNCDQRIKSCFFALSLVLVLLPALAQTEEEYNSSRKCCSSEYAGVTYYQTGDYVEAEKWFRQAAEQGDAGAQFNLGNMYDIGRGVEQSDAEAVNWYRKAAEQGHTVAQYSLGEMYYRGRGIPKNNAEARKWLNLAYAQGFAEAGILLAEMVLDEQKKGK